MNKCMCGSALHIDVGDSIRSGTYRWYASYRCDQCGKNTEIDGHGIDDIPDVIKTLIIKKEGKWGLRSSAGKVKIKYLMDKVLQGENVGVVEDWFFVGTLNQVKWVKSKLVEKGIVEADLVFQRL